VVTICTAQWSLYVQDSGNYMYRQWSLYEPHGGHYVPHGGHCMYRTVVTLYRTVVTICTASGYYMYRQWSLYVPHSGYYMYRQWLLYVPHSGHYIYRTVVTICTTRFNTHKSYVLPTQLYLCVLCGSQNKQPLFPYTALTDWFV